MTTGNIYLSDISQRPAALRAWERQKNKKEVYWFAECFAEAVYGNLSFHRFLFILIIFSPS